MKKIDFIQDVKVGDLFLHPFHYVPSGNTIFKITEVEPMSTRFGSPDRIVRGETWTPKNGEYATLKFIEKTSLWAGSLKSRIPNTIDVHFES